MLKLKRNRLYLTCPNGHMLDPFKDDVRFDKEGACICPRCPELVSVVVPFDAKERSERRQLSEKETKVWVHLIGITLLLSLLVMRMGLQSAVDFAFTKNGEVAVVYKNRSSNYAISLQHEGQEVAIPALSDLEKILKKIYRLKIHGPTEQALIVPRGHDKQRKRLISLLKLDKESIERGASFLTNAGGFIRYIDFSKDGEHIFYQVRGDLHKFHIKTKKIVSTLSISKNMGDLLEEHDTFSNQIRSHEESRDGKSVYAGTTTGHIIKWDTETKEIIKLKKAHPWEVNKIRAHPEGYGIISLGVHDATLKFWNEDLTANGESITLETGWGTGLEISEDGSKLLVTAGSFHGEGPVYLIDSKNRSILQRARIDTNTAFAPSLYDNETKLAVSGSYSRSLFADSKRGKLYCFDVGTLNSL